jgi:hypothetical protein
VRCLTAQRLFQLLTACCALADGQVRRRRGALAVNLFRECKIEDVSTMCFKCQGPSTCHLSHAALTIICEEPPMKASLGQHDLVRRSAADDEATPTVLRSKTIKV